MSGSISLPVGMIVRLLPPEILSVAPQQFEASAEASQEFALPLSLIHHQLPTGRIELSVQDLSQYLPRTLLKSDAELAGHLSQTINLPLSDVYARIPPDLLALRSDQKQIDAQVLNMADPFTEEILREQAAKARAEAEAKAAEAAGAAAPAEPIVPAAPEPVVPAVPMPVTAPPTPKPASRLTLPVEVAPKATEKPFKKTEPLPTTGAPAAAPAPAAEEAPADLLKLLEAAEASVGEETVPVVEPEIASEPEPDPAEALAALAQTQEAAAPEPEPIPEPEPEVVSVSPPAPAPVIPPAPVVLPKPAPVLPPASLAAPVPILPSTPVVTAPAPIVPPVPVAAAPTPPPLRPVAAPAPPSPIKPPTSFAPPAPVPVPPVSRPAPAPVPAAAERPVAKAGEPLTIDLNSASETEFLKVPDLPEEVAAEIVKYRTANGHFTKIEDLLKVPGLTPTVYEALTGQEPPEFSADASVAVLLGFPEGSEPSLKEMTERVLTWPGVVGCVLASESGLPVAGTAPEGFGTESLVAYSPKLFSTVNASFKEFAGLETDELMIPHDDMGFIFMRNQGTYLITLIKRKQLPKRDMVLLRRVLAQIAAKHQTIA
jgi:predicted regulator of Ras-like GTPase activity (Roadblock/LC7/MglB family)